MKALNYICLSVSLIMGLASCEMREEIKGKNESKDFGLLSLNVEAVAPKVSTKAAVPTDNFEVTVEGVSDEVKGYVKGFGKVTDVPVPLELSVGTYNVVSHTKGTLKKQMDYPYFNGSEELTIEKSKTTSAVVKCKMANSRIQLSYTAEFLASFQNWTITLDDGSDIAYKVEHDNSVGTSPEPGYYYFGENGAKYVTLNIRATTVEGNTVLFSQPYYKEDAESGYEDSDSPNFQGGDALIITLKPQKEDTPDGGTINIGVSVNILFTNSDTPVKIPVSDKEDQPVEPEPGEPGAGDQEPSLVLPEGGTFTSATFPKEFDAILKAPAGLKSVVVRISTTDDSDGGFMSTLQDLNFGKEGEGSLLKGSDLINNSDMQTLFDTFSNGTIIPKIGEKEYIFPISAFNILTSFNGTHTFYITLTDQNDKVAEGSIEITIIQ